MTPPTSRWPRCSLPLLTRDRRLAAAIGHRARIELVWFRPLPRTVLRRDQRRSRAGGRDVELFGEPRRGRRQTSTTWVAQSTYARRRSSLQPAASASIPSSENAPNPSRSSDDGQVIADAVSQAPMMTTDPAASKIEPMSLPIISIAPLLRRDRAASVQAAAQIADAGAPSGSSTSPTTA